jgi:DNA-binding NtrC family response regulator
MSETETHEDEPAPSARGAPREETEPRRVLLAEDDTALRGLLAEELESDGFFVVQAKNGYELMEAVARHTDGEEHFDAIVTDIRMPGPEGMFALASLREEDWQTPVIVTTAFGDASTHDEARRLGAVRVLDKPFDYEELRDLLDSVV